jgi:hypothetical protein
MSMMVPGISPPTFNFTSSAQHTFDAPALIAEAWQLFYMVVFTMVLRSGFWLYQQQQEVKRGEDVLEEEEEVVRVDKLRIAEVNFARGCVVEEYSDEE